MNVVFLGPPGAGKGTQAKKISEEMKFIHIATGDILRENVKAGTDLGKKANEYMQKGALVPDDIIIAMVKDRLAKEKHPGGVLFDGFPRTTPQADALEKSGFKVGAVVYFDCPESAVIERISGRRTCQSCQAMYHVKYVPSKKPDVCDKCGGKLYQRADDNEKTVLERLKVYLGQTADLLSYYEKKGLLKRIDGAASPEGVYTQVKKVLSSHR